MKLKSVFLYRNKMASPITQGFHAQQMAQERERVALRISYGTKASTPEIRNIRRMNPLYYSNPLPDNSSGSKMRPFFSSKDESGRPNAMEIVAMNQAQMRGGVLKDYRYAQKILQQRATDTQNLQNESQGLPPVPSPLLQLSDEDSRKLELNTLLTSLEDAIDTGAISALTVAELKNIPRLMIALAPTFTESQIADLLRYFDDMIESLIAAESKPADAIKDYLEKRVRKFLVELAKIVNRSPEEKMLAVRGIAQDIFKFSGLTKKKAEVAPVAEAPRRRIFIRRGPQVAPEEEAQPPGVIEDEEEEAPEPVLPGRPIARPAPEPEAEPEDLEDLVAEAKRVVNSYEGRGQQIPDDMLQAYRGMVGNRGIGGRSFGDIRRAMLNWIDRNALGEGPRGLDKFWSWYQDYVA
jgi:hypothetical protein